MGQARGNFDHLCALWRENRLACFLEEPFYLNDRL
jgi:hypothetical protein